MQQDQSMEEQAQDTRDDASLELVPSVGGDDVAAEDDGYNDGYDGEDLEEEEAATACESAGSTPPPFGQPWNSGTVHFSSRPCREGRIKYFAP